MSFRQYRNSREMEMLGMLGLLVLAITPALASAGVPIRIKLATVPDRYRPTNVSINEPVSMQSFHFEVNPETARARLVVEYTYADEILYEKDDDGRGPQPTIVQLPELKYVPASQEVVYEKDGQETVCGYVRRAGRLLHHGLKVQNTGACTVTSEDANHAEDDGWQVRRFKAIDTYFEVHVPTRSPIRAVAGAASGQASRALDAATSPVEKQR